MMETMKDSGIRWIGEIPESWNTKRIKYVANLKGRIGWQGLTSDEYQDEGAYLITGVDFLNGGIDWENCFHVPMKRWEEAKDIQIENGDLLITKDGTVGKVAIVSDMPGETSLNSGVLRIMPFEGYSRRFLYWVIQSEEFWNWFNYKNAGNSTIIHLYQGDFAEFVYAFPSYGQQEAIADYLDKHCAKLDSIISDLEAQIETLQKYKKSLITETVTKGLDKSAPMKDSGIDWIGKVPERWNIERLKYVAKIKTGTTPDGNDGIIYYDDSESIMWFTPGDLSESAFDLVESEKRITFESIKRYGISEYPCNSVLLVAIGATIGKVGCAVEKSYSNQQITALMPNRMNAKYLTYVFVSANQYIKDNALFTTLPIMNNQYIGNIKLVIPSEAEQSAIVDYLDQKCRDIDNILSTKTSELEKIKDHKSSLIFEYVTGKKSIKEAI